MRKEKIDQALQQEKQISYMPEFWASAIFSGITAGLVLAVVTKNKDRLFLQQIVDRVVKSSFTPNTKTLEALRTSSQEVDMMVLLTFILATITTAVIIYTAIKHNHPQQMLQRNIDLEQLRIEELLEKEFERLDDEVSMSQDNDDEYLVDNTLDHSLAHQLKIDT